MNHEIPGDTEPTPPLLEEGDAAHVPPDVEAELRRPWPRRPSTQTREEILETFRDDFTGSTWDASARLRCWRDWTLLHPELKSEIDAIVAEVDHSVRHGIGRVTPLRLIHSGEPISPPPRLPVVPALLVCSVTLALIECLLISLRVGGAIAWNWGWVLAPVLLPSVVAIVVLVLVAIALAAIDERDAARRRAS